MAKRRHKKKNDDRTLSNSDSRRAEASTQDGNILHRHWKVIATAIFTLFVACIAAALPQLIDYSKEVLSTSDLEATGSPGVRKEGVVPAADYYPLANDAATSVYLRNIADQESAISKVSLVDGRWYPSPDRPTIYGEAPPLDVIFRKRHYDEATNTFAFVPERPAVVRSGEIITLKLYIVEPDWYGRTYHGSLEVVHNDGKVIQVPRVSVDVLKRLPWE